MAKRGEREIGVDASVVEGIEELLRELLPPLNARVHRVHVGLLAERVAVLADPRDHAIMLSRTGASASVSMTSMPVGPTPPFVYASLAVLLVRAVAKAQREVAAVDLRVAAHVEAYARATTDAARRRRLEAMIDETAPSRAMARGDRRALKRHLDLDALRERFDKRRDDIAVVVELGIMAMGASIAHGLGKAHASRQLSKEIIHLVEQADPVGFLLEQLEALRRWTTRLAVLETIERCLESLGPPRPRTSAVSLMLAATGSGHRREQNPVLDRLREVTARLARSKSEHEWVQARALRCLYLVDTERAREIVHDRLDLDGARKQPWPQRDFLVRRQIITILSERVEERADFELLVAAIERGEDSEFVRMAHCEALVAIARVRPEILPEWTELLTRFADEDAGEGEDGEAGSEGELPRVRARMCLALSEILAEAFEAKVPDEVLEALVRSVVEGLARTIAHDRDDLVAQIACRGSVTAIEVIYGDPRGAAIAGAMLDQFIESLHRCLADPDRNAAILEAAASAIEGIDAIIRPERKAWTEALAPALLEVPSGGARRIPVPVHEGQRPSKTELARILAQLTRNDWGVDVEAPQRGRLRVRRGDHRVLRLWRILHELRHPANNKRQAFLHTTGRHYTGSLRAHPGRLDEVTQTVVPGERLSLRPEAGWARHLPLVDDVLCLPWLKLRRSDDPVTLSSSHGRTILRLGGSFTERLRRRLRLNLRYAELTELRKRTLLSDEPSDRRRFVDTLRTDYGVDVRFESHPTLALGAGNGDGESKGEGEALERPVPARVQTLFPERTEAAPAKASEDEAEAEDGEDEHDADTLVLSPETASPLMLAPLDWFGEHLHYFLTLEGNSQEALGLYALGLSGLFLGLAYMHRRRIANARAAIPLSVGGWGTRGKSGTERLKAGLFHGLGFRTFSKTTGCEAMFIHAVPGGPQVEIFTFRPYGKATIWEQRDLLTLAAGLEAEVFLWECMALNPEYVDILQRGWMRDDYATITNTYPDHEDIQGPAGIDVAGVIGRFVPQSKLVISSELGFNPVLRDSAKERDTELVEVGDFEGDLIPDDLLALFPYSEHPRNIALVTEMARQLDMDPELAIVTMADYVYPDLGVLKTYPEVVIRGRKLEFINGHSANERAGFLNNWHRTPCHEIEEAADPARMVVTVVNNRDDRVSRSDVFARLLVNDVTVDAHVLIGTNLAGLQIFLDRALENFVAGQELVDAEGLGQSAGQERARSRLRSLLARVRAPVDEWEWRVDSLARVGLAALGRAMEADGPLVAAVRDCIAKARQAGGSVTYDEVVAELGKDAALTQALDALVEQSPEAPELIFEYDVNGGATAEEFTTHFVSRTARMVVAGRLSRELEAILERRDASGLASFTAKVMSSWTALFKGLITVVWDAGATGDQIIDQCAKVAPPGVHVTVLGTQNIKGTGLDFIYRWLSLDAVVQGIAKLESEDEQTRLDALRALDAHSDFGFTDTGTMAARLPAIEGGSAQEVTQRKALIEKARGIHAEKLKKLSSTATGAAAKGGKFWTWIEGWIDFIDGAVRYRQSRQLKQDLIDYRVSHNKMAVEMREIYARAKGGWLGKYLSSKLRLRAKSGDGDGDGGQENEGSPSQRNDSAEPVIDVE